MTTTLFTDCSTEVIEGAPPPASPAPASTGHVTLYDGGNTVSVVERPTAAPTTIPPRTFLTLANTAISGRLPNPRFTDKDSPAIGQNTAGITSAWSGGTITKDKLVIRGGGGDTYGGEEVYEANPTTGTMERKMGWVDYTPPTIPPANPTRLPVDGVTPPQSHSYGGIIYIPTIDRVIQINGNLYDTDQGGDAHIYIYNPNLAAGLTSAEYWVKTSVTVGGTQGTPCLAYWKNGMFVVHRGTMGYTIVDTKNTLDYSLWTTTNYDWRGAPTPPIHSFCIGDICYAFLTNSRTFGYWNLATKSAWVATPLTGALDFPTSGGAAVDPTDNTVVIWDGGDTVWEFDPTVRVVTKFPGTKPPMYSPGIYGRWGYHPDGYFVGYPTNISGLLTLYFRKGSTTYVRPPEGAGPDPTPTPTPTPTPQPGGYTGPALDQPAAGNVQITVTEVPYKSPGGVFGSSKHLSWQEFDGIHYKIGGDHAHIDPPIAGVKAMDAAGGRQEHVSLDVATNTFKLTKHYYTDDPTELGIEQACPDDGSTIKRKDEAIHFWGVTNNLYGPPAGTPTQVPGKKRIIWGHMMGFNPNRDWVDYGPMPPETKGNFQWGGVWLPDTDEILIPCNTSTRYWVRIKCSDTEPWTYVKIPTGNHDFHVAMGVYDPVKKMTYWYDHTTMELYRLNPSDMGLVRVAVLPDVKQAGEGSAKMAFDPVKRLIFIATSKLHVYQPDEHLLTSFDPRPDGWSSITDGHKISPSAIFFDPVTGDMVSIGGIDWSTAGYYHKVYWRMSCRT